MLSSSSDTVQTHGFPRHATAQRPFLSPVVAIIAVIVGVASLGMMVSPWHMYAWLPGVGLLLLLILGRKPELAFYVVLFLVPWDAVRALAGPDSSITISKFAGMAMVLVVALHMVFSRGSRYALHSNLWRWIGLFLATALISALLTRYPDEAWGDLRKLVASVTVFGLALALVDEKGFTRTVPRVVIFSIGISTFLSVTTYAFGLTLFTMNTDFERLVGVAYNPNHYASFVLFSMPLLAHWFFNATRSWVRVCGAVVFIVNLGALVLTYSRGAFVVSLVIFGALILEHGRKLRPRHLGFLGLGLALVVAGAAAYVPDTYWERQKSISTQDSSVSARLSYVLFAWETWREHPVIGTGIGTYDRAYSFSEYAFTRGWGRKTRLDAQRDAHNTYLEVAVGMGTVGLGLFLGILVIAWRNFTNAIRESKVLQDPQLTQLITAYRLSFVSILAYFFLLSRVYSHYYWLALALSTVALRVVQQRCKAMNTQIAQGQDDSHRS